MLGECKFTDSKVGVAEYRRLMSKDILGMHMTCRRFFSKSVLDEEATTEAEADGVALVRPDEMI